MATSEQQSFDLVNKALSDLSTAVDNETTQSNTVADEIKQLVQDGRNAVSAAQWQDVADKIEAKVSQIQTNNKNISDAFATATAPPAATDTGTGTGDTGSTGGTTEPQPIA